MTVNTIADTPATEVEYAAFIALDWADQVHAWALTANAAGAAVEEGKLKNTPEDMEDWIGNLRKRFAGRPVAVAIEQSRGAVIAMLTKYAHVTIYPIHPTTLACYREGFYPSGAKSDPGDTRLQLELLMKHRDRLSALRPDTVETRTLQFLTEQRRKRVDDKTGFCNELTGWLKQIFPQVLKWFFDVGSPGLEAFLKTWPTLAAVRRARPATLRAFFEKNTRCDEKEIEDRLAEIKCAVEATTDQALLQAGELAAAYLLGLIAGLRKTIADLDRVIRETAAKHPDFHIVKSFPGAGTAMAPRLLAALGTQRDRFGSASDLQCYAGIAPVIASSGQQRWVHWRWACSKFVRQTFQEWAEHSMKKCDWAREFYKKQRDRGKAHYAAIRSLAFKWLRVLYRCWKERVPYDEARLLAAIEKRKTKVVDAVNAKSKPVKILSKKALGFSKLEAISA